ncbi:nuclear transport factor 2 family protein [Kosakonia sp.]|uniref:nuclear transport factor 2 family protein n=1 Tax=Kosakonia sp. TaxID=1916651 RepID=UPI00289DDC77|nr:nuclear transport factor 2 family protein [Kosakonia sp.]
MKTLIPKRILLAALLAGTSVTFAKSTTMNIETTQAAPAELQQLIDNHFALWNNTDAAARAKGFAAVYTADFFVADENGLSAGSARVNAAIRQVQAQHPGFIFTPAAAEWNHGIARVTWGYGPQENPYRVRGEDIFTLKDGKLSSARVFPGR